MSCPALVDSGGRRGGEDLGAGGVDVNAGNGHGACGILSPPGARVLLHRLAVGPR
jgi:hypothetical protein